MHRDSTPRAARLGAASLLSGCQKRTTLSICEMIAAMIAGLDGTVAVVTGGASGIGAACCRLLEASGATVHVADREGEQPVDVTDRTALDALAARLDRLNILINAAGILTENKPVDDLPADDFRRNYEVNVIGTLNACQAFAPLLKAGAGSVVNVASQAALVSLPSQAAYTASKGAVAALTRSLAIDWAEHGIRVNAVAPGFTRTPMTAAFFENETFTRAATRRIPLGRLLEADEIASAIVFLASPWRARSRAWSCPSTAAGRPESPPCPGDRRASWSWDVRGKRAQRRPVLGCASGGWIGGPRRGAPRCVAP